jgi:hypothetical protein
VSRARIKETYVPALIVAFWVPALIIYAYSIVLKTLLRLGSRTKISTAYIPDLREIGAELINCKLGLVQL